MPGNRLSFPRSSESGPGSGCRGRGHLGGACPHPGVAAGSRRDSGQGPGQLFARLPAFSRTAEAELPHFL